MSLSADTRVNMSLDDIVNKTKQVAAKANRRRSKGSVGGNSTGSNGSKKQNNQGNNAKVTKSVGAGKAKRAATVDNRRGLNTTGKATKAQVQGAILRAGQKKRPTSAASAASGLKISFKPKELKQTTEKLVAQQINAVLAKQPAAAKNNNRNNNNNKASTPNATPKKRSVILTPRSTGAGRGNPKKRGARQTVVLK